jgi:sugar phosphate isomerase/epimerase
MTAIGKGTQDFKAIFKESKDVAEWLVVEMDKTSTDVFQVLKESYDFMIQNKFAVPK